MKHLFIAFCFFFLTCGDITACTSAIIGAELNPYGRPLLWKNRDTDNTDNKIEYIPSSDEGFAYVALFNSADSLLDEAWMGMNEYGFAVMNTASYNIKDDDVAPADMDKEGLVMTAALRKCKTVNDFQDLIESLPKPLGVEANFGVIDAFGNGAFFETNNFTYNRVNLSDNPSHLLVRTNYSHTGRPDEGYGFVREANACHLLEPFVQAKAVAPEVLTEVLSRSFYHDLLGKDFSTLNDRWVIDQDFIPRYKSTATIVIEGIQPLQEGEVINPEDIIGQYIMWSGLGYPPCSEIKPVWCSEEGVPTELRGVAENGHSPLADIVKERRAEVFPITKGNGDKYIDMSRLTNEFGTGYIQKLVPQNLKTYEETRKIRDQKP
ncbi:MAG: hypothetical protein J1E78_04275 [Muribaculaceae bacterium]|nr:hypothetical protein [Muribaculaceae bacterium]